MKTPKINRPKQTTELVNDVLHKFSQQWIGLIREVHFKKKSDKAKPLPRSPGDVPPRLFRCLARRRWPEPLSRGDSCCSPLSAPLTALCTVRRRRVDRYYYSKHRRPSVVLQTVIYTKEMITNNCVSAPRIHSLMPSAAVEQCTSTYTWSE